MKIQILTDNPDSWIVPTSLRLTELLREKGHDAAFIQESNEIEEGDILVLLSCEKIINEKTLKLNKHNLVVHESALPQGKGWSPLTWQILEGKNEIPITLFEAEIRVDSGVVYDQRVMQFAGWELIDKLREAQANHTVEMVLDFVDKYPGNIGRPQSGEESYYRRRTPEDSELDIDKSLKEQFDLFRVADNERYPAFFKYRGRKYFLQKVPFFYTEKVTYG